MFPLFTLMMAQRDVVTGNDTKIVQAEVARFNATAGLTLEFSNRPRHLPGVAGQGSKFDNAATPNHLRFGTRVGISI